MYSTTSRPTKHALSLTPPDVLDMGVDDQAIEAIGTESVPRSAIATALRERDEQRQQVPATPEADESDDPDATAIASAQRSPEHSSHPHDLQRGRHVGRHGTAHPVQRALPGKHGVKFGFMSFFVKACIEGLKDYPAVNGSIDGDEQIFNDFYDIGVAVSSDSGLVVLIRDDRLSFAEVKKTIGELAGKALAEAYTGAAIGRHFLDHQRGHLRLHALNAHPQRTPERDPRHAQHRAAASGGWG